MSGLEPLSREAGDFESPMYTIPSHRRNLIGCVPILCSWFFRTTCLRAL